MSPVFGNLYREGDGWKDSTGSRVDGEIKSDYAGSVETQGGQKYESIGGGVYTERSSSTQGYGDGYSSSGAGGGCLLHVSLFLLSLAALPIGLNLFARILFSI